MKSLVLVHWNQADAKIRLLKIRAAGFRVDHAPVFEPRLLRTWSADPPLAFVIDLTRAPSHGRDLAIALRERRGTRYVPIVFAGGAAENVSQIQKLLPDAVYTSWEKIKSALERAISKPPARPIVPPSRMAAYAGTPLTKKLGITEGAIVSLVAAPRDFLATLGSLPKGVQLRCDARGRCDLMIVFVSSRKDLERRVDALARRSDVGSLWLAWRKQSSGGATDVTQQHVRSVGLAAGLVDFKICAIDDTWSALRFAWRKK